MSSIKRLALTATLAAGITGASAATVFTQGSWWGTNGTDGSLHGRDIDGHAVALNDPSAMFFWDSTANITWLADMNPNNGELNWNAAAAWAGSLSYFGGGWRLPTVIDTGNPGCEAFNKAGGTDCGYNVQTQVGGAYSELAHLYYVTLGNKAICAVGDAVCASPQPGFGLSNTAYFVNLTGGGYWSGTEYEPDTSRAWVFDNDSGWQDESFKFSTRYVAAVRTGDVLVGAPPPDGTVAEPRSLLLALSALGLVGMGMARRQGGARRPAV